MHSERVLNALEDMLDNIAFAETLLGDMTEEDFARDRVRFYAVTRSLEIISEASRRLSSEIKDRQPAIAWAEIAGAGNVYRHGYDYVAPERVVLTVKVHLPPLRETLKIELGRHN
jgi:uncharacterized protein with HEPN domain